MCCIPVNVRSAYRTEHGRGDLESGRVLCVSARIIVDIRTRYGPVNAKRPGAEMHPRSAGACAISGIQEAGKNQLQALSVQTC
jgi:hypothetical protein